MQGIPYQYADHKHPRHEEAVQVIENALLEAEAKVKG
jgi:hypothetical protein